MNKVIKVYATCYWQDDESLLKTLKSYGFGSTVWKNLSFTTTEDYDIAIILTSPYKKNSSHFKSENTIVFLTEPPESLHHFKEHNYYVCPMYLVSSFWYRSKYSGLNNKIVKTDLLSAVTSELAWLSGHEKRLEFIYYLDKIINDGFDLYGRKISGEFFLKIKSYRGELQDKFDGLIPYEYHFACENSFIPNYFTEKITDPIIAESLCFYDGCSNICEFIDERAFVKINVKNIQISIETIINAINNNEYKKRLKYIKQQKQRLLYELNPLNIIWAEINGKDMNNYFRL